jgi:hypothetical protein
MTRRAQLAGALAAVVLLVGVYVVQGFNIACPTVVGGACQAGAAPFGAGGGIDIGIDIFGAFMNIVYGIINALLAVVNGIIDLLPAMPDLHLPDLSGWAYGYAFLNAHLPLGEAVSGAAMVLAAMSASFTWGAAVKVYHLIPKPMSGT